MSKRNIFILFYAGTNLLYVFITVLGWYLAPNEIWGLYTLTDGALAAWNSVSIVEWSVPFNFSPYNILQGLGSLYIPNTPWLNPGALAMSFPGGPLTKHFLSYSVYFIELLISSIVLGRSLGLSLVWSTVFAQLLCLIVFPPYTNFFYTLPWMSLAPFNAHLMSAFNLMLALFCPLGRARTRWNVMIALGFCGLVVSAVHSAAVTFLTYIPVYALFGAALLAHQPTHASVSWKLGTVVGVLLLSYVFGFPDFYVGTSGVTSSYLWVPPTPPQGIVESVSAFVSKWNSFPWCDFPMQFLCSNYPIHYFHAAAFAGTAISLITGHGLERRLAIAMAILIVLLHAYPIAAQAGIMGRIGRIDLSFFQFAAYAVHALFVVLLVKNLGCVLGALARRLVSLSLHVVTRRLTALDRKRGLAFQNASARISAIRGVKPAIDAFRSGTAAMLVAASLLAVPAGAICVVEILQPGLIEASFRTRTLPPRYIKTPIGNSIIETLEHEIGLSRGELFKGFATVYFGGREGPLREKVGLETSVRSTNDNYIQSRFYMQAIYGNSFMMTDLWRLNIPSLNEYGQWITQPLFVFAKEMLASPPDIMSGSEINIYRLDLRILQALGVRFIITDAELHDPRLRLRASVGLEPLRSPARPEIAGFARFQGSILEGKAVPVFLYELSHSNIVSYSPTKVHYAPSALEILELLKDERFSLRAEAIVNERLELRELEPARESSMTVFRGHFALEGSLRRDVIPAGADSVFPLPVS